MAISFERLMQAGVPEEVVNALRELARCQPCPGSGSGTDGATGPSGPAGSSGPAGPSGPAGSSGPAGVAGPAGSPGPLGPTGPAGGFLNVANVAALQALNAPGLALVEGTPVWMLSVRDYWAYVPSDTTTPVDGISVASAVGGGTWHRLRIPDASWRAAPQWFIDAGAGNDENVGDTPGAALATGEELVRRIGSDVHLSQSTRVTFAGSLELALDVRATGGFSLTLEGALPAPIASSVAAFTAQNEPLQTAALVTSAAGFPGGAALVHFMAPGRDTWAFVFDPNGGPTSHLSPLGASAGLPGYVVGAPPLVGDPMDIFPIASLAVLSGVLVGESSSNAPAIVIETAYLFGAHLEDQVLASRSALGAFLLLTGDGTRVAVSADDVSMVTGNTWTGSSLALDGVFLSSTVIRDSAVLFVDWLAATLTLSGTTARGNRLGIVQYQGQPVNASLTLENAFLFAGVFLWGTPFSSFIAMDEAIAIYPTGGFFIQTISLGPLGLNVMPPLAPGPVPPPAPCGSRFQLAAAPFFGKAIDFAANVRLLTNP